VFFLFSLSKFSLCEVVAALREKSPPTMVVIQRPKPLESDFAKLLNADAADTADVVMVAANKTVYLHKAILWARSAYYKTALKQEWTGSDKGSIASEIEQVSGPSDHRQKLVHLSIEAYVYKCIVDFMYTGKANIPDRVLLKVAKAADMLLINGDFAMLCLDAYRKQVLVPENSLQLFNTAELLKDAIKGDNYAAIAIDTLMMDFDRAIVKQESELRELSMDELVTAIELREDDHYIKWKIIVFWILATYQKPLQLENENLTWEDVEVKVIRELLTNIFDKLRIDLFKLTREQVLSGVKPFTVILPPAVSNMLMVHFDISTDDSVQQPQPPPSLKSKSYIGQLVSSDIFTDPTALQEVLRDTSAMIHNRQLEKTRKDPSWCPTLDHQRGAASMEGNRHIQSQQ
jgi:hypothetical protein